MKNEAILLEGCEVKMARQMDVLEVIVKPGTEIGKFKKEFTVAKEDIYSITSLDKVKEIPQYQRIVMHQLSVNNRQSALFHIFAISVSVIVGQLI